MSNLWVSKTKITVWIIIFLLLLASCQPVEPNPSAENTPELPRVEMPHIEDIQETSPTEEQAQGGVLSIHGPWMLLHTPSGLWIQNPDGTALKQIYDGLIISPSDLNLGLAHSKNLLAFISAVDTSSYAGLSLIIMQLPQGTIVEKLSLASPDKQPSQNVEVCEPIFESARAATIGQPVAWSPDQSRLAFTAIMDGASADVYIYDLASKSVKRVSDEPGQAYDLHWHWVPSSQIIAYFSADCFGSGAGFSGSKILATDAESGEAKILLESSLEIFTHEFLTWVGSGEPSFVAASVSGCPYRDLRIVDVENQSNSLIHDGCFNDYAIGPNGSLAILIGEDFSKNPGVYIYNEPEIINLPPALVEDENAREINFISSRYYVQSLNENGSQVYAVDWNGEISAAYPWKTFPAISKDESSYAWSEAGKLLLTTPNADTPFELCQSEAIPPYWYEAQDETGAFNQYMLFGCSTPEKGLFLLSSPNYQMRKLNSEIELLSEPIMLYEAQ